MSERKVLNVSVKRLRFSTRVAMSRSSGFLCSLETFFSETAFSGAGLSNSSQLPSAVGGSLLNRALGAGVCPFTC